MALIFVRVEIHHPKSGDYERLHEAMEAAGYSRNITGDQGTSRLPTGVYCIESSWTAAEIATNARNIAAKIEASPMPWVLAIKSEAWALYSN